MLKFLLPIILGTVLVLTVFFSFFIVEGNSMSPLIEDGDIILVKNRIFSNFNPKKGDILVFRNPETGRLNVKQCSALDGGGIFLTGLNLPDSTDSRHFGRVRPEQIRGKVLFY